MGGDTKRSSEGHQVTLERQTVDRSEETYAGPQQARRHRRERTVAVVGASSDRRKFGNKCVRAYAEDGYTVWPVNPKGGQIEGLDAYAGLDELPGFPFIVSLYLHEDQALGVLDELAAMEQQVGDRIGVIHLNPGVDTPRVRARAAELDLFVMPVCSVVAIGKDPGDFPDT